MHLLKKLLEGNPLKKFGIHCHKIVNSIKTLVEGFQQNSMDFHIPFSVDFQDDIQLTEYEVGRFALYEVKSCCSFYIR